MTTPGTNRSINTRYMTTIDVVDPPRVTPALEKAHLVLATSHRMVLADCPSALWSASPRPGLSHLPLHAAHPPHVLLKDTM